MIGFTLDFNKYIERLIEENSIEAVNARIAQNLYPDLYVFADVDGNFKYASASLNKIADKAGVVDGPNGSVWLMPYEEAAGVRVFTDPPLICLGYAVQQGFGIMPTDTWEETASKLTKEVKSLAKDYLAGHPPILW